MQQGSSDQDERTKAQMKQVMVNGLRVFAAPEPMCRQYAAGLIRQVRDMYQRMADQANAEGAARRIEIGQLTSVRVSIYTFEITDHFVVETREL